ncbi:hypothetical protein C8J56DRAFT_1052003 [Mycena floridula]|nr:hypothetical protein C8J56DRAFT_1052003 [Mycena floridula]
MIFNTRHGSADAHIMDSGRFQKDAFNSASFNNKNVYADVMADSSRSQDGPKKDSFNNQQGYADAYFMHGGRLLQDVPIETALMIDMAIMIDTS